MRNRLLLICSVMLLVALSGCTSAQHVAASECPAPAPAPAWMMLPAPDLLTPLNEIISSSESVSPPQKSK